MMINRYKTVNTFSGDIYNIETIREKKWYFIVRVFCLFKHKYHLTHDMLRGYYYQCYRCDKRKRLKNENKIL
jgi:hypothetical protein